MDLIDGFLFSDEKSFFIEVSTETFRSSILSESGCKIIFSLYFSFRYKQFTTDTNDENPTV